jgi:hypothetical protein
LPRPAEGRAGHSFANSAIAVRLVSACDAWMRLTPLSGSPEVRAARCQEYRKARPGLVPAPDPGPVRECRSARRASPRAAAGVERDWVQKALVEDSVGSPCWASRARLSSRQTKATDAVPLRRPPHRTSFGPVIDIEADPNCANHGRRLSGKHASLIDCRTESVLVCRPDGRYC